jgi:hypothetical protein
MRDSVLIIEIGCKYWRDNRTFVHLWGLGGVHGRGHGNASEVVVDKFCRRAHWQTDASISHTQNQKTQTQTRHNHVNFMAKTTSASSQAAIWS